MCPIDPTPHGGEILHQQPERQFPPPKDRDDASQNGGADILRRPALPDNPEQMAVDVEDEEADPVIDSGPGISK